MCGNTDRAGVESRQHSVRHDSPARGRIPRTVVLRRKTDVNGRNSDAAQLRRPDGIGGLPVANWPAAAWTAVRELLEEDRGSQEVCAVPQEKPQTFVKTTDRFRDRHHERCV